MLKKILFSLFLVGLSLMANAQNDPNMRDRVEQRMDNRSNGDMRQRSDGDRSRDTGDRRGSGDKKGISNAGIAICAGEFALCASSTCKPTGKTITVKEDGGKTTKQYPESICKCPIITPQIAEQNNSPLAGIAGLNEGNMKGSCRSPGTGKIWSYFSTTISTYPQEQPNGEFLPPTTSVKQNCSGGPEAQGSNCWSYICTIDPKETNNVRTATCRCPYGEGVFGQEAKKGRGFVTFAGGTWTNGQYESKAACKMLPVGFPDQLLQ